MKDDLNFFIKKDDLEINATKSKNNGCGIAPGNLVLSILFINYDIRYGVTKSQISKPAIPPPM